MNEDFIKTQFCWVDYTKKGIICQATEKTSARQFFLHGQQDLRKDRQTAE